MNPAPVLELINLSIFCGFITTKGAVAESSLLLPELAHCTSCSRILFELSGAHAGQGRCLTDLHSLFPQAVYHCHNHSPNQPPLPASQPPAASFLKD